MVIIRKYLTLFFDVILVSILLIYNNTYAQKNDSTLQMRDSIISAAKEIISSVKYCALITIDSTGCADIRTMNPFPPDDDMTVWMATNSRSRKYNEIKKNPNVTLYYANHSKADGYVAIKGKAVLVNDSTEIMKRKRDYWEQAFPDWKYLVLIKIIPEKLEVINYKRTLNNSNITWEVPSADF
ncbi:MAG: pyridoxamine 5'-phosphate oxidase family protein [Ignavibacteriaceae bacterium]